MNVSRYIDTTELRFDVEFVTPCFLGGADQNAEIRTAPFKNLLRRWWRIANGNLAPEELWQKESELFGSTEKNPKTGKIWGRSKVILEIERNIDPLKDIVKDILEKKELKQFLYLGYGPVQAKTEEIKDYIKPGSNITIKLKIPSNEAGMMINVLTLINLFGSIGSRSRKGFGSLSILPKQEGEYGCFKLVNIKKLRENLPSLHKDKEDIKSNEKHYPYYLACDDKGMYCWNTTQRDSYQEVLCDMTDIYRTVVDVAKKTPSGRTILGTAKEIKNTDIKRIPSPLLMKVVKQGNKYSGRLLHLSYNISDEFYQQNKIWKSIYDYFDSKELKRFGGATK